VPVFGFVLFDINDDHKNALNYDCKKQEAERLGLHTAQRIADFTTSSAIQQIKGYSTSEFE
jgi:hypothetical protein